MLKTNTTIRELKKSDLQQVKHVIDENQMFPSEYLDNMVSDYFKHSTEELWFVTENANKEVVSVAYCAPERMTSGTWNLLLIAVAKKYQGKGVGGAMMHFVEQTLVSKHVRVLLVETSGLPDYQLTRAFYPKYGYKQIAKIPEYYDEGDDKIVFWKSLMK